MIQKYEVVVFDWEGTLADTYGQVLSALKQAVEAFHLESFEECLARQCLQSSIRALVKRLYPHLSLEKEILLMGEVEYQLTVHKNGVYLMPGANTFIERLHQAGMKLAIATNKSDYSLQRDLYSSGLSKLFKLTRSANQTQLKPHPQMLEEILDQFQVTASQMLMIGDSESDMIMAQSIEVDAVGIDVGHQMRSVLLNAGAKQVFENYEDLSAWFFKEL